MLGQMPGRHVGLLLQLAERIENLQPGLGELGDVERVAFDGAHHHLRKAVEVLLPFAAAQINAEAGRIERRIEQPRGRDRLLIEPVDPVLIDNRGPQYCTLDNIFYMVLDKQ